MSDYKISTLCIYLRLSLNLTQSEYAKTIGVSRVSIANYETGNQIPSLTIFIKMLNNHDNTFISLFKKAEIYMESVKKTKKILLTKKIDLIISKIKKLE